MMAVLCGLLYVLLFPLNPLSWLTIPIFSFLHHRTLLNAGNIAAGMFMLMGVGLFLYATTGVRIPTPIVLSLLFSPILQSFTFYAIRACAASSDDRDDEDDSVDDSIDVEDI